MSNLANIQQPNQPVANGSEAVLNIVMKKIRSIYPAWRTTIKSQAELDGLKTEWLIAFQESRISTDIQINRGLAMARKDTNPFLPSSGQFIDWCKPTHASHQEFVGLEHHREPVTKDRIAQMKAMTPEELKVFIARKEIN